MKNLTKFLTVFLLALLGANLQPAWARRVYLNPSSDWKSDNAKFAVHYWRGKNDAFAGMMVLAGETYYVDIPDDATKIQFCRMNNTWEIPESGGVWNWGKEQSVPQSDNKDLASNSGWSDEFTWSKTSAGFETSDNGIKLWYNPNNKTNEIKHGRDGVSVTDIGTVTDLYLKEYYVKLYQNSDNLTGATNFHYKVWRTAFGSSGSWTSYDGNWGDWKNWDNGYRKPIFGRNNINNGDGDNLLSGLASGKYTIEYYFDATKFSGETLYCNNGGGGGNFQVTFTYNPLTSVSGFSKSVSVTPLSGEGTNSSPYIFKSGESVTLTVSATACSDANATLQFSFDNGSNWVNADANNKATTTISTTNTSGNDTKVVKYRYYNSTDNLSGEEGSTTIYFKTTTFSVTLKPNGGTINSGDVTQYTYGVGATLPTSSDITKAGYDFQGWYTNDQFSGDPVTTIGTTETGAKSFYANWTLHNYTVTYDPATAPTGCTYTTTPKNADYNTTVNMTFTPATNYVIASVTAYKTGDEGTTVEVTRDGETNNYSFTQPAYNVTVKVEVSLSQVQVTYGKRGNGTIVGEVGGTDIGISPASVDGGATVVFTATPDANYTVEGWYDNASCTGTKLKNGDNTGNPQTYTIENIAGAKTVYVKFQETKHAVTIDKGTGISSVTPSDEQQVGNVNPVEISATVATGYTIANWTYTGGVSIVSGQGTNSISIKATAEGTITANATENLSTITISSNNTDYGTVNVNNASVGVTTTQQLVATNEYGYKFKEWDLQGGVVLATGAKTDATITIKGDGNSTAGTAQAIFEEDLSTPWRLNIGVDNQGGWQQPNFVKRTGESVNKVAYVSVELTGGTTYHFNYVTGESTYKGPENDHAEMPANTEWTFNYAQRAKFIAGVSGTYTFKIDYSQTDPKASYETPSTSGIKGDWTGWAHEDGTVVDNVLTYTHTFGADDIKSQAFKVVFNGVFYGAENAENNMTRQNCSDWELTSTDGGNNINLNVDMVGQYTFTYNSTTNKLSVTYPTETMTDVTVYLDGETASTVQVGEATHPTIVAVQYVNGKRFAGWQADEGVTLANANDRTTQITAVTGTGKSVRATYNSDYMVYFKNTPGWDNVYVFLYNTDSYWDADKGTGVKYYDKNQKKDVFVASGYDMVRLNDKSDIWYFDYSGVYHDKSLIAFNDHRETNNEWFEACQAAYRSDWDKGHNLSVFVPEKNISEKKNNNSAAYYNKGYWMKYDDLKTGYYLRVKDKTESGTEYEFKAASAGEPYKATITLEAGQTKEFWINGVNGSAYKNAGTMTSSGSHSGWEFYEGNQDNCKITTTSEGTYTFTLTFGDGMLLVSVEYPLSVNDYRVVYTDNNHPCHPSTFIRKSDGAKDTVSFFIDKAVDKNAALKFQYCSNISGSTVTWTDVEDGTIDISGISETGIYNFYLEQTSTGISCTNHKLYDGDFYIRTAIAAGGWDAYKGSDDNLLPYIEYGLDESQPFKFTHAYTNWVEKDKNVKFCIANDYSLCISDTLVGDDIIGKKDNADWLKNGANIRFMWNKNTNALSRAYISGSTNDEDRFLMLVGDVNMFDDKGVALPNNELKFTDKNNWVYQADIKAKPGCAVKLTAQYTIGSETHTQYFMGTESTTRTIISGSATDKQYTMRVVYDFKTNRLTAGWVPDGTEISSEIILGGDMLLVREHQGDANQITFSGSGQVSDIHHIYGVLTLKKDSMAGTAKEEYKDKATNANYGKTMYWISFPFDVNISEIFGVDGYGKKWIMQKYNGQRRADIGWFAETSTFWEYMDISEKLNAYEGYLFIVDANYFNTTDADVWKNSATEANFYFPSAEKNIGIINKDVATITVPEHECKINRTFGDNNSMNHMITDSHWNVIGVPTFQNSTASTISEKHTNFKSYYAWVPATNGYSAQAALGTGITFNTMQAYMVQYAGTITWSDVSVVSKAPYAYADEKNYMVELFFNGNGAEDHTYINLADGAHTDFELNEDMMKIDNAGFPNIYSFAGAYDVAYNETTFDNQSVILGVSAPKDGSYTFAMPKEFSGKAVLVDLESGEATDLNLSNYTVELNKSTYNNRFQLLLEVEAQSPTNMNPTKGEWSVDGKTKKLLINDNIYLINAGRIYNASGTQVK